MKVWYSKKWDMYVPTEDWWERGTGPNDLVPIEIEKEEIVCDGGDDEPSCHAERWELMFEEENVEHSIMTKIPWKQGKYKITIEEARK